MRVFIALRAGIRGLCAARASPVAGVLCPAARSVCNAVVPGTAPCFPSVLRCRCESDSESVSWAFVAHIARGVYVGLRSDSSSTVIVKFAATYSRECHEALATAGLAPQCLGVDRTTWAPWIVVVMEHCWEHKTLEKELRSRSVAPDTASAVAGKLRAALTVLKREGLAVGDLRPPNVLIRGAGAAVDVKMIDFDWGGRCGDARFSSYLNPGVTWPAKAHGRAISHDDDEFMVEQMEAAMFGGPA